MKKKFNVIAIYDKEKKDIVKLPPTVWLALVGKVLTKKNHVIYNGELKLTRKYKNDKETHS